ncbi:DUF1275 family protein [Dankookia sp. P2]|uniref:DUF1275 family protein n=1 Tax=Dankookia sp. P2 TaxID=3423955 RepID=UPI003D66D94A
MPFVALAGCVDAIGWLRFDQLFVSFISGTSTMLGIAAAAEPCRARGGAGDRHRPVRRGRPAGAVVGALAGRWRGPAVLCLVAALLTAALLAPATGGRALPPAAWAMVPAMGMLNTALPGVGGITFVTGAMSRAMEGLVQALLGRAKHAAWAQQAACWAAMASGALLGAVLQDAWGDVALAVPATGALLGALVLGERTVVAAAA